MGAPSTAIISCFSKITKVTDGEDMAIDMFLDFIKEGKWQDIVIPLRVIEDEKKRKEYKSANLPYVTISGHFPTIRNDNSLKTHSGFICIDVDDVDPNETKSILCPDKYVYSCFTSASGRGVAILFKINPEKHAEAFRGLQEYLFKSYNITCDPLPDVSRPRFVSYDPHIFINESAVKFALYPKEKPPKKIDKIVYAKDDFDRIIQEIQQRGVNICEDYHTWLRIGFSLADKFGDAGRDYFHIVSSVSNKYSYDQCEKQYRNILKHTNASGRISTIATFYYHAKQSGITIYSEQTKTIARAALQARQGGRTAEQAIDALKQFEQIPEQESRDIVTQVFNSNIDSIQEDSLLDQIEHYLKFNHNLRRNVITRYIEDGDKILQQKDFNTIYISLKKSIDKVSFEIFERIINSDFTKDYNPLIDFLEAHKDHKPTGAIKEMFSCIKSDDPKYVEYFGTKWLVSIISAIHGIHSPFVFVLCGNVQNTGKTQFFRRLLPKELKPYYGESKLDAGKDDEILMTQKVIIMDDEMGGKSKKDQKRLKDLTSKEVFSLREPYGRNNVDLVRLAVLCGTTNELNVLNDPTGNRRVLPVIVHEIDNARYNKINKLDIIMEAYHLYLSGYNWELNRSDIDRLAQATGQFEDYSPEYELITKYYRKPVNNERADRLTATEIKVELEKTTQQKLSLHKIGQELNRIGYIRKSLSDNGSSRYVYNVIRINPNAMPFTYTGTEEPFPTYTAPEKNKKNDLMEDWTTSYNPNPIPPDPDEDAPF